MLCYPYHNVIGNYVYTQKIISLAGKYRPDIWKPRWLQNSAVNTPFRYDRYTARMNISDRNLINTDMFSVVLYPHY